MEAISNLLIAIPIGIIYNILVHKLGEIFNDNLDYNSKIQKNLLLSFGGGIIALLIASLVFGEHRKYQNRTIRYGFYIGAFLLLFHSILYNWKTMENDIKFIVMMILLVILISYTYISDFTPSDTKNKIKLRKTHQHDQNDQNNYLPATYINYPEPFHDEKTDFDEIIEFK
jgi:hypothetical protein